MINARELQNFIIDENCVDDIKKVLSYYIAENIQKSKGQDLRNDEKFYRFKECITNIQQLLNIWNRLILLKPVNNTEAQEQK